MKTKFDIGDKVYYITGYYGYDIAESTIEEIRINKDRITYHLDNHDVIGEDDLSYSPGWFKQELERIENERHERIINKINSI